MSFLSGIISTILSLVIGVLFSFFVLLALNGFSGKAGEYGVYTYFALVVIFSLIIGALSFLGTGLMIKKSIHTAISVIVPIVVSIILALGAHFLGTIISAIVASEIWGKR